MNSRKHKRRFERPPSTPFNLGDGLQSQEYGPVGENSVRNRKAMQLCRQVEQTLHLALADCADPILQELLVLNVQPFPDSSRLLVTVQAESEQVVVLERLHAATRKLRREVAAGIHRRKTPDLAFHVFRAVTEAPSD